MMFLFLTFAKSQHRTLRKIDKIKLCSYEKEEIKRIHLKFDQSNTDETDRIF